MLPPPRIRDKRSIIIRNSAQPKILSAKPFVISLEDIIADIADETKKAAAEKKEIYRVGSALKKRIRLIITEIMRKVIMHTANPLAISPKAPFLFLLCPLISHLPFFFYPLSENKKLRIR